MPEARPTKKNRGWWVYVLWSESMQRLYKGITTDVDRRLKDHNGVSGRGAKSTRMGRPWVVGYVEPAANKSEALRREYALKRLPRSEVLALICKNCG